MFDVHDPHVSGTNSAQITSWSREVWGKGRLSGGCAVTGILIRRKKARLVANRKHSHSTSGLCDVTGGL